MKGRAAAFAVPLALAAALRFSAAWSLREVYPGSPDEGYYETSVALQEAHAFTLAPNVRPALHAGQLWPALLAAADAPFSRTHPAHARMAAAAVGTVSVAAVFSLGELLVSPWAGLAGALGAALDPRLRAANAGLNVQTFYGLTLLVCAAAAASWAKTGGAAAAGGRLGAVVGASLACRFSHYPLPAFLLAAALRWFGRSRGARSWFWAMIWAGVFLLPVIARNGLLFGRPLAFDSGKGSYHLLKGTVSPETTSEVGEALELARRLDPSFPADASSDEQEQAMVALAKKQALDHPLRYLGYCARRQLAFWGGMPWLTLAAAAAALLGGRVLLAAALPAAALSGYAVAGGQPEHAAGALPLLWALAGAAAALAAKRAWPKLPAPPAGRPWGLQAAGLVFGFAYASALGFMALELRDFAWKEKPPAPSRQRALDMLALAFSQRGLQSQEGDAYIGMLTTLAADAGRAGKDAEEAGLLERAAAAAPGDVRVLTTRAQRLERLGKLREADAAWRAALAVSPGDAAMKEQAERVRRALSDEKRRR
jgi:hypothetical protein